MNQSTFVFSAGKNIDEVSEDNVRKIFTRFIGGYVFLSGLVLFEPGPAEFWFLIFLFYVAAFTKFDRDIILLSSLLFGPTWISAFVGQTLFHVVNFRFLAIDLYLFLLFVILSSFFKRYSGNGTSSKIIKSIFVSWTVAGVLNILACLVSFRTFGRLFGVELIVYGIRFKGYFKDPNVLGPFLVPPILYFLDRFFGIAACRKKTLSYFSYFTIFLVLSFGVLMTFSRSAWLNYAVSLMVFFIMKAFRKDFLKILLILLFVVFLVISVIFFGENIKLWNVTLTEFLLNRSKIQSYDRERFEAQQKFILILRETSVSFGAGPGNYEHFAGMSTHSLYLRFIGERGVLGTFFFLIFLTFVLLRSLRISYRDFVFPAILGQLVNSLFIDSLHWRHLWLLFALVMIPDSEGVRKSQEVRNEQEILAYICDSSL